MPRRRRKTSRPVAAIVLGLLATALVAVGHLKGLDRRTELHALDLRLRTARPTGDAAEIVHVDIDDRSLAELGRWPWPRERLAGMIDVLSDCGARAVALDVILPEPQKVRYVHPAGEVYGPAVGEVLSAGRPKPVYDDDALARAIGGAGRNVSLPMHIDFEGPDDLAEVRKTGDWRPALRRLAQKKIDTKVRMALSSRREVDFKSLMAEFQGEFRAALWAKGSNEYWAMIEKAYLRRRAIRAMRRLAAPVEGVGGYPMAEGAMVPPLVTFGRAAPLSGFVTVKPDADGVVRRIRLLGRSELEIYMQYALAVAADRLAGEHGGGYRVTADGSRVTLEFTDGVRREIPVDRDGMMLIHWPAGESFQHLAAAAVVAVWAERRKLDHLDELAYALSLELITTLGEKLPEAMDDAYFALTEAKGQFDDATDARLAKQGAVLRDQLYRPSVKGNPDALAGLARAEEQARKKAHDAAKGFARKLREQPSIRRFLQLPKLPGPEEFVATFPATAAASQSAAGPDGPVYRRAREIVKMLDGLPGRRRRIEASVARLRAELAEKVKGRICLIGSTATGAADFVPTPIGERTPGVVVHSSILDMVLAGRFLRASHLAVGLAVIFAAGAAVTLLAAVRPVLQAGAMLLVLAGGYAAVNVYVVFGAWGVWLPAVAPLAAMAASFAVVTACRQLTEERAKRRIRAMFAHALSPTLVERLLEDPSLAELGGQKRPISCLFGDLAGFTALSQRLGPSKTVSLLNRYFDLVTDIIQNRRGGYVNKFLGDGVFALFGAPVSQSDHPSRAIGAAVDCHERLAGLNEAVAEELGAQARLALRIGITTGEAMVGNCGATQRMDYTAIGDCVNLASRLESANKFFGTGILLSEQAWRRGGGDGLVARSLGPCRVVGVRQPVSIWEVLGRTEAVPAEAREALASFAAGIEHFAAGEFAEAGRLFERVREALPGDRPAQIFAALAAEGAALTEGEAFAPASPTGDGVVQIVLPETATPC